MIKMRWLQWKFLEMDAELDPFEDKLGDVFEDAPFKRRPYKEIRKPVSAEYLVKKKKQVRDLYLKGKSWEIRTRLVQIE